MLRRPALPIRRPRTALVALALVAGAASLAAAPEEASFLAENDIAMAKMMVAMEVKPTGDIDADFVAMMVPHHQGAIAMAQAELRYGRNEQLRRLAQEIIVTQQQEIAVMQGAIGHPPPPSSPGQPTATAPSVGPPPSHPAMSMHQEP